MPRLLASTVAILLLASVLTGCSVLSRPSLGTPKVGSCWEATRGDGVIWADWQGAPAVKCSAKHDDYTFGVGEINAPTGSTLTVSSTNSAPKTGLLLKADAVCSKIATKVFDTAWDQQLILLFNFFPTIAQWKSGARWVRCDVALAAYGTPIGGENILNLPAHISSLISANHADPLRYAACLNDPGLSEALQPADDPSAIVADCRTHPEWMLKGHGTFAQPIGAKFPSAKVMSATLRRVCGGLASATQMVVEYGPTARQWAYGGREVMCWAGSTTSG